MLCLLYIANINFEQDINIINGEGKGTCLKDIFGTLDPYNKNISDDSNSYFLDNYTGDLYKFRQENMEWQYKGFECNFRQHWYVFETIYRHVPQYRR